MTTYRLRVLSYADGSKVGRITPWIGPKTNVDRTPAGYVELVVVPQYAVTFDTQEAAHAYWKRQSSTHPTRDDGKPNRPLAAFDVLIEPVPEDHSDRATCSHTASVENGRCLYCGLLLPDEEDRS